MGSIFLQCLWKLGDKKRRGVDCWDKGWGVFHCRLPSGRSLLTPRKETLSDLLVWGVLEAPDRQVYLDMFRERTREGSCCGLPYPEMFSGFLMSVLYKRSPCTLYGLPRVV